MIEDDERLAAMVSEYLATSGLQVTVAPRADRGLSLLAKGGFQAVLLDVMLPDADGFEVCRRIRAGSDVPVLMLTARGDDTDRIVGDARHPRRIVTVRGAGYVFARAQDE